MLCMVMTRTTIQLNSKMTEDKKFEITEDGKLVEVDSESADFEEDLTFDG